jgi:branched-chain amino acid transport system permease protein
MLTDAGPGLGAAPARTRTGRQAGRARAFRRVLPWVEAVALIVALAVPVVLSERTDLVTLATNVLILSLLAISFDLCWGLSGIMSFGQALFFGVAGYAIALVGRDLEFSQLWGPLPPAMLVGLLLAGLFAAFLLLGRKPPTSIFVALGTLTGAYAAERLVSGWQYVGAGNGL